MDRPRTSFERDMSAPHPLVAFYRTLSARRRWQLAAVLAVTLAGALAELMTIGASLGFLTLIAAPQRVDFASGLIARLGGDPVVTASMLLVAAAIAAALIRLVLLWLSHRFVMAVGHDMAARIFGRMLRQPYADYVRRGSSEVLSGIEKVQSVVADLLQPAMQGLTAGLIALLIVLMLFAIDALAASLAAFIVVLVYGVMSRFTRGRLRANSQTLSETGTARIKIIQESLGGIRDIILDHAQPLFEEKFRRIDSRYRRARATTEFITAAPRFVVEAAGIVAIALTALAMSFKPHGIVAAIPILGALALGMQRLLPLLQLTYSGWSRSTGTLQLLADVVALMNAPVVADQPGAAGAGTMPLQREIRFEKVSYRHGESGFAIDRASLAITQGSRTGISGPTGAGKSTLLDLIIGLLEPDSGTIRIDDQPLDRTGRGAWMAGIAHVPQSIYLADDSLAANIAFGKAAGEIDRERLAAVIEAAQLSAFIAELPDGLATRVGERGIRLSGGQRQRVGIARALYKQAPVLILDEATSALDDATQAAVMDAIMKLDGGRTIIIVAHRRSTLEGCDQILHVEAGRVTAGGRGNDGVRPPRPSAPRSIRSGRG
jgi:ABC-type multidrug transport system fused ATPase/permease subunit